MEIKKCGNPTSLAKNLGEVKGKEDIWETKRTMSTTKYAKQPAVTMDNS